MFELDELVRVIDTEKVDKDTLLEDNSLKIIQENNYRGQVTKIDDSIYFVEFKNEFGWVTQGYKSDEIEVL